MKDGIKTLNENKKDSQLLRSECATLEHQSTECLNDILKEILEDINNLEKDFRKIQQQDLNEVQFLKQQAGQLQQEKMRLQQNTIMVDNRVTGVESEVGYE